MAWELTGNADATAASFLGSTNAQPLIVRAGTTPSATPPERLRILPDGKISIGTTTPQARLSVAGGGAVINSVAIGTDTSGVGYHNEHETVGAAGTGTPPPSRATPGLAIGAWCIPRTGYCTMMVGTERRYGRYDPCPGPGDSSPGNGKVLEPSPKACSGRGGRSSERPPLGEPRWRVPVEKVRSS